MASDPWAGLREVSMGLDGYTQQPAAQNPFNALLDPSRGGLFGLLGRMSGAPTREEAFFKQAGQEQQRGLSAIAARQQRGMSPQQAIVDFVSSPEGMDFFSTQQDPVGVIKNYLTTTAAPAAPENLVVSPGQQVLSGADPSQVIHSVPTMDVQNQVGMSELANLKPDEIEAMARAQMAKNAGLTGNDATQQEAATADLVKRGLMSEDTRSKLLGGVLQIQPIRDKFGDPAGHVIIDLSNPQGGATFVGTSPQVGKPAKPGDENYAPGITEGTRPDDRGTAGSFLNPDDPGDIILGAGLTPVIEETAGGVLGGLIPGLAGEESARRRNALRQIKLDAQSIRGASEGRGFSADVKQIESIIDKMGVLSNPVQQGTALLQWHDYLDRRAQIASTQASNPNTTPEQRGKAEEDLNAIRVARGNLPPREALIKSMDAYKASSGQIIPGIAKGIGAAKEVEGKVEETVTGEKPTPTPDKPEGYSFKTEAEAMKAVEAGTVKPGMTIIINGVPMVVEEEGK